MKNGSILPRSADAGVRGMTHSAVSVAVMAKEALHLVLHITGFDASHDLLVGVRGDAIRVPNHLQLHICLEHAQFGDHRMKDLVVDW